MNALEIASTWLDQARDYGALYWRQIGLIASMLFTAGLLFWRLGERSRHADQEMVLTVKARLEEIEADEPVVFDSQPEPDVFDLPAEAAIHPPGVAQESGEPFEDLPAQPVIRPARQHATLREAIEAMKADMARTKSAVQA